MVQKSSLVTNGKQEGEYMGSIIIRPDMQSIDAEVYRRYFRHCRFKGGGSTTVNNTSTYTPTPYELEMQQQEANYSKAIAPNALELNNLAMNVLKNSLGTVQVDYNGMNKTAQNQIANATNGMNGLVDSNNAANSAANRQIGNIAGQYQGLANNTANQLGGVGNMYSVANAATNHTLGNVASQYHGLANSLTSGLGDLSKSFNSSTTNANNAIANAANKFSSLSNDTSGKLGNLSGMYTGANSAANGALGSAGTTYSSLAQGNLPSAYQQNMENSISSALNNTIGKTISNLGNRGVLNSSVTSSALNDIEKNAADSVAQQYQNNINQVANLTGQQANTAQQQMSNTFNTAGHLGNILSQQQSLQGNAINQQANAAQQGLSNAANAANFGADILGQSNTAQNNALGQQAELAQQQFGNATNTAGALGNIATQQHSLYGDALSQLANAAQQQYTNSMNTNSQNSGLFSNLINSATTPITTASVSQEAAQTPASNLWNMSLGLNGATNNALVAAAGKGTTTGTQTSATSGGGGFLSGLFGGAMAGLGGGLGRSLFCFPAGTKVRMANGTEKSIEYMQVGDVVQTDGGKAEKVVKVMDPHYNDVYAVICEKGHTNTTTTQPLMKPDGTYIKMGDLKIGTELKNVGKVQSIVYSGERRVYDLQVDGENNYIADGFVAQGGDDSFWKA